MMAREFAREGSRLVLCARDEQELQKARADVEEFGAEVITVLCDITDMQAVNELIAAVSNHFGPVDVLVNNAGTLLADDAE